MRGIKSIALAAACLLAAGGANHLPRRRSSGQGLHTPSVSAQQFAISWAEDKRNKRAARNLRNARGYLPHGGYTL